MLLVPCPPSERMASKMAWYSGVNGAGVAPPLGWLWSYRPGPPIERHWPLKSGYFVSSHASASAIVTHSVARNAIALIDLRQSIVSSLGINSQLRRPHRRREVG